MHFWQENSFLANRRTYTRITIRFLFQESYCFKSPARQPSNLLKITLANVFLRLTLVIICILVIKVTLKISSWYHVACCHQPIRYFSSFGDLSLLFCFLNQTLFEICNSVASLSIPNTVSLAVISQGVFNLASDIKIHRKSWEEEIYLDWCWYLLRQWIYVMFQNKARYVHPLNVTKYKRHHVTLAQ